MGNFPVDWKYACVRLLPITFGFEGIDRIDPDTQRNVRIHTIPSEFNALCVRARPNVTEMAILKSCWKIAEFVELMCVFSTIKDEEKQ